MWWTGFEGTIQFFSKGDYPVRSNFSTYYFDTDFMEFLHSAELNFTFQTLELNHSDGKMKNTHRHILKIGSWTIGRQWISTTVKRRTSSREVIAAFVNENNFKSLVWQILTMFSHFCFLFPNELYAFFTYFKEYHRTIYFSCLCTLLWIQPWKTGLMVNKLLNLTINSNQCVFSTFKENYQFQCI